MAWFICKRFHYFVFQTTQCLLEWSKINEHTCWSSISKKEPQWTTVPRTKCLWSMMTSTCWCTTKQNTSSVPASAIWWLSHPAVTITRATAATTATAACARGWGTSIVQWINKPTACRLVSYALCWTMLLYFFQQYALEDIYLQRTCA